MSKITDLLREQKFIKNKEHLSKEDYERLAEIEEEIKEINDAIKKEFGKDNDVPTRRGGMMENKILILRKMVAEYEKTTGKKATVILMNPETLDESLFSSITCINGKYYIFGITVIFKAEIKKGVIYVGDIKEVKE